MLSSLKPLGLAFEQLSATYAVTQLSYTVDVHGTSSITATVKPEREQCITCGALFSEYYELKDHYATYPAQCDIHGVCLRCEWRGEHHVS